MPTRPSRLVTGRLVTGSRTLGAIGRLALLPACLTFVLAACGGDPAPGTAAGGPAAPAGDGTPALPTAGAEGAPAAAGQESGARAELDTVPSQDEMDARAAEWITGENADEVYEQLEAELLGDSDPR
jgi:hypothetical protein